jgi:D-glycerate 3-kinase
MDAATMQHFLMHFERLSRHALATLPTLADTIVEYDDERHVTGLEHG